MKSVSPCKAPDVPLDVLGAESEGQIGYLLETALSEALPDSEVRRGIYLSTVMSMSDQICDRISLMMVYILSIASRKR